MPHTVRMLQAWFLALLLLAGGTLSSRVCADCPSTHAATVSDTGDTCCDTQPDPQPDPQPQPGESPDDQPDQGCDCPFGCCPVLVAKAVPAGADTLNDRTPHAPWDIPTAHADPSPASEGPRRPPRV